ncbi:MAG: HAD family phosphatase [Oscillospiraceae bacterium]|nr:HAD family phosphatase [Oscillospiraceae bacterium]
MKAVLFDMDGVLLDSEIPSFSLLRNTLVKKGAEITLEDLLERYTGVTSNDIYAELIEKYSFGQSVDEFRLEHRRLSGNYYMEGPMSPMPGVVELLEHLCDHGKRMAVVSSTHSQNVLFVLNRLSILRYFDAIVCGDMVEKTKPSPEGYLKATEYLGLAPSDCLIVEDSPIGIRAAKNAGIMVAGYKGSEHVQDTSQADIQVASHGELLEWLLARGM